MKKLILMISILITISILTSSGNIYAQTQRETLNMLIDIRPYITLEIGEDINIFIEQPWQKGKSFPMVLAQCSKKCGLSPAGREQCWTKR